MNRLTENLRKLFSLTAAAAVRMGRMESKGWILSALGYRFSRMNYRIALVLLVITVAVFDFVGLFYRTVSVFILRPVERSTVGAAENKTRSPKDPLAYYKVVLDRNLFGSTDKAMALKQGEGGLPASPDTASNWELRGTVACDDKFGFAIVEDRVKKKQSLVKVGGRIADATLIKVARDTIVLKIGDREETLKVKTSVDNAPRPSRMVEKMGPLFPPPGRKNIPVVPPDPMKKLAVAPAPPHEAVGGSAVALKRVERVTPIPVREP